jgi:hypothetical protein
MTDFIPLYRSTWCECGQFATTQHDYFTPDPHNFHDVLWEVTHSCDAHRLDKARELDEVAETVVTLPVRYVIDGVVWPPTLGLTGLTGGGTAA